jgi:hypothetical protein
MGNFQGVSFPMVNPQRNPGVMNPGASSVVPGRTSKIHLTFSASTNFIAPNARKPTSTLCDNVFDVTQPILQNLTPEQKQRFLLYQQQQQQQQRAMAMANPQNVQQMQSSQPQQQPRQQ